MDGREEAERIKTTHTHICIEEIRKTCWESHISRSFICTSFGRIFWECAISETNYHSHVVASGHPDDGFISRSSVTNSASIPSSDSMSAIPFSGPSTKQAVLSASPSTECSEKIVTLASPFSTDGHRKDLKCDDIVFRFR